MTSTPTLGRVLITGCAGFIGSHFTERLLESGHTVTGYDNLSLSRRDWIERLLSHPNFTFVKGDLRDLAALTAATRGQDTVVHLGANTDIPAGLKDPRIDLENCTIATFNMLEAMRQTGVKNILFASSSTVYGETEVLPTPESTGPTLPVSLYGAGKLAGEGLISAYCGLYGMRGWIFRFGNVMGARMNHGVVFDFVAKLRRNPAELEILGDGKQEKNFFLVEDCIDGMLFAFEHAREKPCNLFNLGNESTTTVTRVADLVVEEMGLKDVQYSYSGGDRGWPGDVPKVIYDLSKMRQLGWIAKSDSDQAVRVCAQRLLAQPQPAVHVSV